ncbi:MAG TPA: thiamine pyrophosphate-binding protein [Thermoleophilaceae bacterium]|nr:thiamine pyrophosphate-binding protein [Thermoleophilaceae bacterium]
MISRSGRSEAGTTVVDVVARSVLEAGGDVAFGVVGSGNFTVTAAFVERGGRFVAARHEGGAACMADAHARVTGRLGVCSVHQGPGVTNAMTGIAEAAKSRTPLIVLAGDTPAAALHSNFRIDQGAMVDAVGATADRVYGAETAAQDVRRALRRAVVERRTVVLMLPLDVQGESCAWSDGIVVRPGEALAPVPASASVAALADLLQGSRRVVLLAGRGAVLARAGAALERLAECTGALLATSAMGHGLFAGHPWNLGISGGFASPLAAELLPQADAILAFGAQLTRWTTRQGGLIGAGARVAQVDVELEALGANAPVDVAVLGDARATAEAVLAELESRGHRARGWRDAAVGAAIAGRRWRDEPFDDASDSEHVDPRALTIALDELLPAERTVVVDSGHFMGFPPMYMRVPDAAGFVFTQAFQSIGLGLANAIGAAIARPDRLAVASLGDGGALMSMQELETAVRLRLPLLAVVYNDAAYGAEVHHFRPRGHDLGIVRFPDTDIAALARGAGAEAITARAVSDLAPIGEWLARRERPLLVDAKVNPDVRAEWLEEAFRSH